MDALSSGYALAQTGTRYQISDLEVSGIPDIVDRIRMSVKGVSKLSATVTDGCHSVFVCKERGTRSLRSRVKGLQLSRSLRMPGTESVHGNVSLVGDMLLLRE